MSRYTRNCPSHSVCALILQAQVTATFYIAALLEDGSGQTPARR
jgi:hypothetical protein